MLRDPTVWAIPLYFGSMALERSWYRSRPELRESPGAYARSDTTASLTMGTLSLIAPLLIPPLLRPFVPGRGRFGKALLATAAAAAVATTIVDRYLEGRRHLNDDDLTEGVAGNRVTLPAGVRRAQVVQNFAGPVAMISGGVAAATVLSSRTNSTEMFARRLLPDLGSGPAAFALAMVGWDFLYYWSHRLQHEHRYLWSIHVVHHSSEHYNLSTALRQPVAESFGTMVPYGVLGLLGVRPDLILKARGFNLIWQFWIHTESVRSLGAGESLLSTPSAHRVHHGANSQYLDRNHGGILIIWDRLFGTFEPEVDRPIYGLTKNIHSFSPWTIATHEYRSMLGDVARARSWRERFGFVVGPPGWRPVLEPAIAAAS